MQYRKAGISQYTRRLIQALAQHCGPDLAIHALLDRRDRDRSWLPRAVIAQNLLTPAHHRFEAAVLPLELLLRIRSFDLIHFPDFVAFRGRFKKVVTIHDLYFMRYPEVMSADGARYYGRTAAAVARADAVITVSAFTRSELDVLLPAAAAKTSTILEAADQPPDATLSAAPEKRYVLFVGTFEPRKNLATLLQALVQTAADVRLTIVGEAGWSELGPAAIAQSLGVSERITFAGRVDDATLDRLLRGARALVLPSLSEGFGLPVLEAMSRGTPVICANSGALPEVAGEAALLHTPDDHATLAAHINMLWSDDTRYAELRALGLAQASRFSWTRAAEETLMVYRRIAQST